MAVLLTEKSNSRFIHSARNRDFSFTLVGSLTKSASPQTHREGFSAAH